MFRYFTAARAVTLTVLIGLAASAESLLAVDYWSGQPAGASVGVDSAVQPAAFRPGRRCPCPPGWVETTPGETATGPQAPGAAPGESAFPQSAFASAVGATSGPETAVPNMIGDTLSGGFGGMRFFGTGDMSFIQEATIGLSGGNRRFKIADDENPLPVDRVFINYNHFQNPLLDTAGNKRNLEAFTFGAEKTFLDGTCSVELRVPFSSGYNSTQVVDGGLAGTEFGDMTMVFKQVLLQRERFALSAGLGVVFPSGPDWKIVDTTGTAIEVWNESVHLDPFLGAIWAPTDRLFFLFFGQLDFDTTGDTVLMRTINGSDSLGLVGLFSEQNLAMFDISVGYRLYQNPSGRYVTGIIPMAEVHYTTTLQDMDFVTGPMGSIGVDSTGTGTGRRDIVNCTGGVCLQLGPLANLTVAGVLPATTGLSREFDSEVIVQFDRRF